MTSALEHRDKLAVLRAIRSRLPCVFLRFEHGSQILLYIRHVTFENGHCTLQQWRTPRELLAQGCFIFRELRGGRRTPSTGLQHQSDRRCLKQVFDGLYICKTSFLSTRTQ